MKAAPLKGDCKVCQFPEPLRLAVNGAIWTDDGIRYTTYIVNTNRVLEQFPDHKIDRKTVMRHVEHVEAVWHDVRAGEVLAPGEVPIVSFGDLASKARFVGSTVLDRAQELVSHPAAITFLKPSDFVAIGNMAVKVAATEEQLRVKARGQDADLIKAAFLASSGHLPRSGGDDEGTVEDLRAEVHEERRLLAERAAST